MVSPSQSSSARDGILGSREGAGIELGLEARCGALASKDGGIGMVGCEFSLRDFERLQEGRVVACVVGGRKFDPCLCDIRH